MNEDYIDIPFVRPYTLTENSLNKICDSLANSINCRIQEIHYAFDKSKGYYFYGPYDICVADLLFDGSEYRGVQIYGGIIDDLRSQLDEERRRIEIDKIRKEKAAVREEKRKKRNQYILQKYVIPGVAITMGGIVVLSGIGAIRKAVTKEPTAIVQQDQNINTVANANDLILYAWSTQAMTDLYQIAEESSYDSLKNMAEKLREDYFTPIMSSYYNYVEEGMLGLPVELTGESIKTNHNSFRNNAYLFDEALQNCGFKSCSFANSSYANAIVVDAYGEVVASSQDGLFGEVYDSKGELITLDSEKGYIIYIRAQDVLGNKYGTSNYPEDSIMYKGVAYVNSSHIYDFEEPSFGSK